MEKMLPDEIRKRAQEMLGAIQQPVEAVVFTGGWGHSRRGVRR